MTMILRVLLQIIHPHLAGGVVEVQAHVIGIAAQLLRQITLIIRESGIYIYVQNYKYHPI